MAKQVSLLFICVSLATTLHATTYDCTNFTLPGASSTSISSLNNAGTLAGIYTSGNTYHGIFGNASSGNFQTVDYPGGTNTRLFAINNNGVASGEFNYNVSGQTPGWFTVDSALNFKPVTAPAGYSLSSIYGINDKGAISAVIVNTGTSQATFAILNADGTFAPIAGLNLSGINSSVPSSINTAPKMLEVSLPYGGTSIADTSGNVTTVPIVYAYGLNNAGLVVGYTGSYNGHEIPFFQYSWDSSTGVSSELFCPGVAAGNIPDVSGVNDNGVVVGAMQIMTPVPGQPQISLSTNSVTFPPVPVGQTTPAQNVMLTNTGNARLDIAQINESTGAVSISGCLDPSSKTASLDPGVSCTLGLRATPTSQGTKTGTLFLHDSVTGSPQTIALTVTGTAAPPTCTISVSQGSPKQANFTFQDTNSGMQSITLLDASNATVNIPTFVSGSTVPLTATATQSDPSQAARVDLQGTNVAGGSIACGQTFGGGFQWTNLGGSFSGKIALMRDFNSNLHAFVRGGDNAVWHNAQTSSGSWSGWESTGGSLAGDPVVPNPNAGLFQGLYVFGRGTDGALWYVRQTGGAGPRGPASAARFSVTQGFIAMKPI